LEVQSAREQETRAATAEDAARSEQKKVEEALKKAEALKVAAAEDRARVEDAPARAAKLLEEARATESKAAAAEERIRREQAALDAERERLNVRSKAVAAEREKLADDLRNLEAEKDRVEKVKAEGAELRKQAASERAKAKEELEQASQKEKKANQHRKKVEEGLELIKGKLKAKASAERRAAVLALAHIGSISSSFDYDLSNVAVFDPAPALRKVALEALEKVQPELYPLAVTLTLPAGEVFNCTKALKELPRFGRAGLPLIAGQLQSPTAGRTGSRGRVVLGSGEKHSLLMADIEALAAIASNEDAALNMLLALPESPLALSGRETRLPLKDHAAVGVFYRKVGQHAAALGKAKPEARKVVVPYFVKLLASADAGLRELSVDALASFGADAKSALPALRQMRLDPAAGVRNAVTRAIVSIDAENK
jgi:hypothetical protein